MNLPRNLHEIPVPHGIRIHDRRDSVARWILAAAMLATAPVEGLAQARARKQAAPARTATVNEPDAPAEKAKAGDAGAQAPNATIAPEDIREFKTQPAGVRQLLEACLALAQRDLTYTYGSADPAQGGMDCSGFVHYALRQHGFAQVPRDARGLYSWVRKAREFRAVVSRQAESFEFDELLPGDLLFWTGTYAMEQDPPVTHVMIYLGTEKAGGGRIMIGSSDGRSYHGLKRNGVSVFDFTLPRAAQNGETRATFIGYARIPGLRD